MGGAGNPKTRVKLWIELGDGGDFAKSTASSKVRLCVITEKRGDADAQEIGRSELLDASSTVFKKKLTLDYFFELKQKLTFEIYDGAEVLADKLLATASCSLGRVVGSKHSKFSPELMLSGSGLKGPLEGAVAVLAEEVKTDVFDGDKLSIVFKGMSLAAKDPLLQGGKSDPYLKILRTRKDGELEEVYKSEVVPNNLNPAWNSFEVKLVDLCNGDLDAPLIMECWDHDKAVMGFGSSTDDMIGKKTITARQLIDDTQVQLEDYKQRKVELDPGKIGWESTLTLEIREQAPTFLDYFAGGYNMKVSLAIDFTGSNGNPSNKKSLHYMGGDNPNDYQRALSGVLDVLLAYDDDDMVDVMGFGGIVKKKANHCFPLNSTKSFEVGGGVKGVLETYKKAVTSIPLSGPTNFCEVIQHVVSQVESAGGVEAKEYNVLLIITDGAISDVKQTTSAIINASALPISIIIVGVGHANFGTMEKFDSDDKKLLSVGKSGRTAKRDIV